MPSFNLRSVLFFVLLVTIGYIMFGEQIDKGLQKTFDNL
jgi:hypothetical protein